MKSTSTLSPYQRKRNFQLTKEPRGKTAKRKSKVNAHPFFIQKHDSRRPHYDLRLEMAGTLKSWAVPKGLSDIPGEKRLAVQVEDHPLEYAKFEGEIPKGEYGAGHVSLWDKGIYSHDSEDDLLKALEDGHLELQFERGSKAR